jgi:hypothetical protein
MVTHALVGILLANVAAAWAAPAVAWHTSLLSLCLAPKEVCRNRSA